jgi:PAS domain-containing protein
MSWRDIGSSTTPLPEEAEKALRESEQRLRWIGSVVESSDDAIVSMNVDGIISSWNGGAERLYNYTVEEARDQRADPSDVKCSLAVC